MTPNPVIGDLPYPIIILDVNISSLINKDSHCRITATFNSLVQWSFLRKKQSLTLTPTNLYLVVEVFHSFQQSPNTILLHVHSWEFGTLLYTVDTPSFQ